MDEDIVSIEIHISARVIHKDFPLFQSTYPFHIVIPYTREMTCLKECVLTDIPAGSAEVILITQEGARYTENVLIAPDTQGILNIRSPIHIQEVKSPKNQENMINIDSPPESIFYKNTPQGLWLLYDKGRIFVYDA